MLVTKLKSKDTIEIGEAKVTVEVWTPNIVKLYIDAPKHIKIKGKNINTLRTVDNANTD